MRDRKQGPTEDFHSYYALRSLANRLKNSLTEDKLAELLLLKPDAQRHLLYFSASMFRELRKLVQQNEILGLRLSSRFSTQLLGI